MKIRKIDELEDFIQAVHKCEGQVTLTSQRGDYYDLKSLLSAIHALTGSHGDELELFCSHKEDEQNFFKFFNDNPDVLK